MALVQYNFLNSTTFPAGWTQVTSGAGTYASAGAGQGIYFSSSGPMEQWEATSVGSTYQYEALATIRLGNGATFRITCFDSHYLQGVADANGNYTFATYYNDGTPHGGSKTLSTSASNYVNIRVNAVNGTLNFRVWADDGSAEPTSTKLLQYITTGPYVPKVSLYTTSTDPNAGVYIKYLDFGLGQSAVRFVPSGTVHAGAVSLVVSTPTVTGSATVTSSGGTVHAGEGSLTVSAPTVSATGNLTGGATASLAVTVSAVTGTVYKTQPAGATLTVTTPTVTGTATVTSNGTVHAGAVTLFVSAPTITATAYRQQAATATVTATAATSGTGLKTLQGGASVSATAISQGAGLAKDAFGFTAVTAASSNNAIGLRQLFGTAFVNATASSLVQSAGGAVQYGVAFGSVASIVGATATRIVTSVSSVFAATQTTTSAFGGTIVVSEGSCQATSTALAMSKKELVASTSAYSITSTAGSGAIDRWLRASGRSLVIQSAFASVNKADNSFVVANVVAACKVFSDPIQVEVSLVAEPFTIKLSADLFDLALVNDAFSINAKGVA